MCGTCHMASSFLPLSWTATTTICNSGSLLNHHFHATSHSLSTSTPLFTTSAPLPGPFVVFSILRTFYAINQLLAKNSISTTSAPHQNVPTPHPGCPTSHQVPKGPTPLLALLLTSIRAALLTLTPCYQAIFLRTLILKNPEDLH